MNNNNFIGCFVSLGIEDEKGEEFKSYIFGSKGIGNILKTLRYESYGNDLNIILFQFYVNPIPYLLEHLKEIENYRKKEKSIGLPIIVNNENFFSKNEEGRLEFLKKSILRKLDILFEIVLKKKLDTNIDLLKQDCNNLLS